MSQGYPPDWSSRRQAVYKRDDYTCQNCGARGGPGSDTELHAHHIVPKSKGGTHKKSNLKTVCKDCHDAIHGESMAPSASSEEQSRSSGSVELPLDPDEFSYAVAAHVGYANVLNDIHNDLKDITKNLHELAEYAQMYDSLSGTVPDRLASDYSELYQETGKKLDLLQEQLDEVRAMSPDEATQQTNRHITETVKEVETLVEQSNEYRDALHEIVTSGAASQSDYYNIRLLNEDIVDTMSTVKQSIERAGKDILNEIEHEHYRLGSEASRTRASFLKHCPLCGEYTRVIEFSGDDGDQPHFNLIRCEDCRTEWISKSIGIGVTELEVVHSEYDIEGHSLAPEVWQKTSQENEDGSINLDEYKQISDKYTSRKKILIVFFMILELIVFISSYLAGSFALFVISSLIVLFAGYGVLKHSRSTLLGY